MKYITFTLFGLSAMLVLFAFSISLNPIVEYSIVYIYADYKTNDDTFNLFSFMSPTKKTPKSIMHETIEHSAGTGFAINGKIYTCYHVIQDCFHVSVMTYDGKMQDAKIERTDKDADLAELSIENCPRSLTLANKLPSLRQKVIQIGDPIGLIDVISEGKFLGYNPRSRENIAILDTSHGNSGSPVFNSSYQVIGMTHMVIDGTRFTGIGTLQELKNFIYPYSPK